MFNNLGELSHAVGGECAAVLSKDGKKPGFAQVKAAYAKAARLAFDSEFGGKHPSLGKWVEHLAGLKAINYTAGRKAFAGPQRHSSLEEISREVLRHHLDLAQAGKPDLVTRSAITGISSRFTKGPSPRLRSLPNGKFMQLTVIAEKGIRGIISRQLGGDYISFQTNLNTSFDAAERAIHAAIIRSGKKV